MKAHRNIYVIGYPKTGTTWMCRLLGDILDCPVGAIYRPDTARCIATEGDGRPGNYYIGHGHQVPTSGDKITHHKIGIDIIRDTKLIVMTRNTKDVIVSAMHHWKLPSIRATIDRMYYGKWPITHGGGYEHFYAKWNDVKGCDIVFQPYECLYYNTREELEIILDYFKISVTRKIIDEAIERQSFNNRRRYTEKYGGQLSYGKEFQLGFLRKGIVGDWHNYFNNDDLKYYNSLFDHSGVK